jgi:peptide/nickel transport system permease protein
VKYISRRLAHTALLMLALSFFSFCLAQLAPGDFFDTLRLNPQTSPETVERMRSEYGLDRSLLIRYRRWLASTVHGKMGRSLAYNSPVGPLLLGRVRNTLLLTGSAVMLSWLLALPLGIWSAIRRGSWPDRTAEIAISSVLTVPDLLVFLALLVFAVRTGWFPAGGMLSLGASDASTRLRLDDFVHHLFLPALGLAVVTVPVLFRHVRAAIAEMLEAPFLRAARGHGISEAQLLFRYALPAAANPLISLLGFSIGSMLSMSLLAEVILGWPGIGPLFLEAILARDTYVVIAVVMASSAFLIFGNLFADVLLYASDPRIRVE